MIDDKRLLNTFIELIKIDSPSGEESKLAGFLEIKLTKLGGIAEYDSYKNLIVKFKGEGEPLMLNAHMDTVEPGRGIKPIIEGDIIKTDGSTVLGADPKAGVTAILEAITSVLEDNKNHPPIEIVFTREEETGLNGAMNLDYSKISARRCITFDEEERVTNVAIAAPGYIKVDLKIIGRSAHAGIEPEKGISAIRIASEIISQLEIGRIDHETTANIGLISGGSARNAVPEEVAVTGEIRSRDLKKLEKHSIHFQEVVEKIREKYSEASITVDLHEEFAPYKFQEEHKLIQLLKSIYREMGLEIHLHESGGGTDVNILHTHGIQALCVGFGGYNAHTKREYAKISEMIEVAKFAEKLILTAQKIS